MAALTTQVIRRSAITPSYAAAAGGGDTFTPGQRVFLHVKIGSTATTVTVAVPAGKGVDFADMSVGSLSTGSVTSAERMLGPFPADLFADPVTGQVSVTYSQVTGVTIGVFDMGA